jgi:hypothetical protein
MDDAERLHPLVAAALGQVASLTVQLEYWEDLAVPWRKARESPPEALQQRLDDLRSQLEHRQAMTARLREKLALAVPPQIETL